MAAVGPRPDSGRKIGEVVGGRSKWGSGVIAPHRYLTVELRDKSSGNVILVINDDLDVSSTLRSCGFAVCIVS